MKQNYVNIQGWMYDIGCEDLKEIVAYAVIFGFSQDGESKFTGSLQYVMQVLKCSKPTAISTLKSLEEKGLIEKEQVVMQGVTFNRYSAILQVVKNLYHPSKISLPNNNIDNKVSSIEDTSHNNIEPILFKEDNNSLLPPIVPQKEKRFSKPSLEEVSAYCSERKNGIDPQHFIDYYESNGWKVGRTPMKDWKAAVRTWERKEVKPLNRLSYGNSNTGNGSGRQEPRQRDYSCTTF